MSAEVLRIEEGKDYVVGEDIRLPYETLGLLGYGGSGIVEKVKDVNTEQVFACKTIHLSASTSDEVREHVYGKEIPIIRSLRGHHHIIRVFATYVSETEVGLVLQPVADQGDLEKFLAGYTRALRNGRSAFEMRNETTILYHAFGCLATALAFMHRENIRHKDIKPRNILIHRGAVVYTDFGYSLDSSELGHSTTTGVPNAFTRKYAAPEVLQYKSRNSSSDIFSLGCVFLEILSAISCAFDVRSVKRFSESIDLIHSSVEAAVSELPPTLSFLVPIILPMTKLRPSERPAASNVVEGLLVYDSDYCCDLCRELPTVDPVTSEEPVPSEEHLFNSNTPQRAWQEVDLDLTLLFIEYRRLFAPAFDQEDSLTEEDNFALPSDPSENMLQIGIFLANYSDIIRRSSLLEAELQRIFVSLIPGNTIDLPSRFSIGSMEDVLHPIYRNRRAYVGLWSYTNMLECRIHQIHYKMAFKDIERPHVSSSPIKLQVWADEGKTDYKEESNRSDTSLIVSPGLESEFDDPLDHPDYNLEHQTSFDCTLLRNSLSRYDQDVPAIPFYPPSIEIDSNLMVSQDPNEDGPPDHTIAQSKEENDVRHNSIPKHRIQCLRNSVILTNVL